MSSLGGEWRNLSLQPEDVFEADEDGRFKAEAGESLLWKYIWKSQNLFKSVLPFVHLPITLSQPPKFSLINQLYNEKLGFGYWYYFYATFSTLSLLIKALALLLIRLYLSKASQASLLGLNDICIYFLVLINL
jgi:hypothetical protein